MTRPDRCGREPLRAAGRFDAGLEEGSPTRTIFHPGGCGLSRGMTGSYACETPMFTCHRTLLPTVLIHVVAGSAFGWLGSRMWVFWSVCGVQAAWVDQLGSCVAMWYLPPILPSAFLITRGLLVRRTTSLAATVVYGLLLTSAQALTFLTLWAHDGGTVGPKLVWWAVIYSMAGAPLGLLTDRGCRYLWSRWDKRRPRRGFPAICNGSQTNTGGIPSRERAGAASRQTP